MKDIELRKAFRDFIAAVGERDCDVWRQPHVYADLLKRADELVVAESDQLKVYPCRSDDRDWGDM